MKKNKKRVPSVFWILSGWFQSNRDILTIRKKGKKTAFGTVSKSFTIISKDRRKKTSHVSQQRLLLPSSTTRRCDLDFARCREFTFTIHNASRPSIAGRLGPGSLVTPNSCSFGFGSHRVTEPALSLPGFRCIDKSIIGEHIPMAPTDTGQLRNLDTTKPTSKGVLTPLPEAPRWQA